MESVIPSNLERVLQKSESAFLRIKLFSVARVIFLWVSVGFVMVVSMLEIYITPPILPSFILTYFDDSLQLLDVKGFVGGEIRRKYGVLRRYFCLGPPLTYFF